MKKLFTLIALLAVAVSGAWAAEEINETYDFQAWGTSHMDRNTYADIVFSATSDFSVAETDIYKIEKFVSAKDGNELSAGDRIAASNNITLRWGRGGSDYPRLGTENAGTKYISIINLKAGDKVRFNNISSTTFMSANVTYENEGTPVNVAVDDAVAGNVEYTITENGHIDMKVTGWGNVRQIYVTRYLTEEEVSKPTLQLTGTSGTSRIVTITSGESTAGNSVATYYTTDGTTPTSASTLSTGTATVTSSCTVKAISISSEGTSSSVSELSVVAGTMIKLAEPTINTTAARASNGIYYPTYAFSSDNSATLGAPTATYTYSFNGSTPVAATQYEVISYGILTVTANATGYESTSKDFEVYVLAPSLWVDYTANDYAGNIPGVGLRKWSGNDHWSFEAGKGYKAVRMDGDTKKPSWIQIDKKGIVAFTYESNGVEHFYVVANNDNSGNNSLQNIDNGNYLKALYSFDKAIPVAISSAKYATFYTDFATTIPSGVTAYTATDNGETIGLEEITDGVVPANTGVILYSETAATYNFVATNQAGTFNVSALDGTLVETEIPAGAYVLGNGTQGVGFYHLNGESKLGANKAYLPDALGTKPFIGFFDNATDAGVVEAAPVAVKNGKFATPNGIVIVKNGVATTLGGIVK